MLSTMKGMPCFLAMAAMAGRSTTIPPGLAIDSQKIAFVFGVIAVSKLSGSVASAQATFQLNFLNE